MGGYFRILAAIPGFFLSAWFLMLLWGVFSPQIHVANHLLTCNRCW